jgi:predicted Zn-dependent protease
MSRARGWVAALLYIALASVGAGCEPTAPVRDCTGCTYDFADTIPPDTLVFHWPVALLPVRFYADPRGAMPALVSLGVGAWEAQFLYGEFRGVLVSDSSQADVIVGWNGIVPPDVPPDPGAPVSACDGQTVYPSWATGSSPGRTVHVTLGTLAGYTDAQVAACLRRVAMHELGHALGLLKHSPSSFDIMHQTPTVALPSSSDRRTVEVLYHTAATVGPPPR